MGVREALEAAIGECQQWAPKSAAILRRLLDSGFLEAAMEVMDSIPASYDHNDPLVQRHAAALNRLRAAALRAFTKEPE